MIALDDLGPLAPLLLQFERRLEEVHMQSSRGVEASEHGRRLGALEAPIANKAADDRAILYMGDRESRPGFRA